tara:strand:+ start:1252 stop:3678 length:2427 start_codon:yes stop_codon:yes gene_type:complete
MDPVYGGSVELPFTEARKNYIRDNNQKEPIAASYDKNNAWYDGETGASQMLASPDLADMDGYRDFFGDWDVSAWQWEGLELTIPTGLESVVTKVQEGIEQVVALLELIQAILEFLLKVALAFGSLLLTVVQELQRVLDELLGVVQGKTALHGIWIPPQIPPGSKVKERYELLTDTSTYLQDRLESGLEKQLNDFSGSPEKLSLDWSNYNFADAMAMDVPTAGGTDGFIQAVERSMNDTLDSSRPQFGTSAWVAGLYLVYGGTDLTLILELWELLKELFSDLAKTEDPLRPEPVKGFTVRTKGTGAKVSMVAGGRVPADIQVVAKWKYPDVDPPNLLEWAHSVFSDQGQQKKWLPTSDVLYRCVNYKNMPKAQRDLLNEQLDIQKFAFQGVLHPLFAAENAAGKPIKQKYSWSSGPGGGDPQLTIKKSSSSLADNDLLFDLTPIGTLGGIIKLKAEFTDDTPQSANTEGSEVDVKDVGVLYRVGRTYTLYERDDSGTTAIGELNEGWTKAVGSDGEDVTVEVSSPALSVDWDKGTSSSTGIAPDWTKYGSIGDLLKGTGLEETLVELAEFLKDFEESLQDSVKELKKFVEAHIREIKRWIRVGKRINALLEQLKALLSPKAGIHALMFFGKGGNEFALNVFKQSIALSPDPEPNVGLLDVLVDGLDVKRGVLDPEAERTAKLSDVSLFKNKQIPNLGPETLCGGYMAIGGDESLEAIRELIGLIMLLFGGDEGSAEDPSKKAIDAVGPDPDDDKEEKFGRPKQRTTTTFDLGMGVTTGVSPEDTVTTSETMFTPDMASTTNEEDKEEAC